MKVSVKGFRVLSKQLGNLGVSVMFFLGSTSVPTAAFFRVIVCGLFESASEIL